MSQQQKKGYFTGIIAQDYMLIVKMWQKGKSSLFLPSYSYCISPDRNANKQDLLISAQIKLFFFVVCFRLLFEGEKKKKLEIQMDRVAQRM